MARVIVRSIIIAPNGDVLFLRRSPNDDYRPGGWDFPGGDVEPGEDPLQAVSRETREETGIVLKKPYLVYGRAKELDDDPACRFIYVEYVSAKPALVLSDEHSDYSWMSTEAMLAQTDYDWHRQLLSYIVEQKLADPTNGARAAVTCRSLLVNPDGQVLMARRGPTDPFKPGKWDIPGGGCEAGESPAQAVVRETREEVGVTIDSPELVFAITAPRPQGSRTWVFFVAHTSEQPVLGDEHDKLQWIDFADLPNYTDYEILLSMHAYVLSHPELL